ncbi:Adenosinetriphosphatase [Fasciola hepatica]|uniref:Adenosinetriphosphatase n=1 Tax=Fasciola hepatica TaxID=6192 RepID=A0A4E0R3P2_FASHE|nr:Adenosinetriphosphatase [Fasciola hepatica]
MLFAHYPHTSYSVSAHCTNPHLSCWHRSFVELDVLSCGTDQSNSERETISKKTALLNFSFSLLFLSHTHTHTHTQAQQLFSRLGVQPVPNLTDYEVGIAVNLVDTRVLSTDWDSIGGLDSIIEELQESVIQPFQQVALLPFPSRLLKPPKGVLLFGPPGCGKTMLARAMARAANAYFINLQISTLVNMWYGETQKYVEATFSLAYKLQPSIIFIDELDSFLTTRSYTDNESTRMIKTQFMALWDGLLTDDQSRILIVGATNRPDDLDQAILRRLPYKVSVPMPNQDQRVEILSVCLHGEPLALGLGQNDLREIASRTDGLSGSELHELCREAAFCCYRQEKNREIAENIRLKREHFFLALRKFQNNRVGIRPRPTEHPMPLD